MATVKLIVRGKKNPSNLYVRFSNGRAVDIFARTNIFINPSHWDSKKSNYRNLSEIENRAKLSMQFEKLKIYVLEQHNEAYMFGDVIDKYWLQDIVNKFFKRPKKQKNLKVEEHYIYYAKFVDWWLKEIAPTWKTAKNKTLSERAIQQYESFYKIFKKFKPNNIRIKNIDHQVISDFVDFLCDKEEYSPLTAKRMVGRLKFFLNRADKMKIETDPSFQERVFVDFNEEDVEVPYLNESEIEKIYNLDLSNDDSLDNIRDGFIIGLWTGLRISDFNDNLDISNIKEDFIEIKTTKTGAWVVIPVHPNVKNILNKRLGNLPVKYSDKHFNESIKKLCMLVGIDQPIKGKLFNKEKKRKIVGVYEKYKLITSHTCRRSFCTNLFGIVSNSVIMEIGGWKSEKMMLHYMKKTKRESALVVQKVWSEKYK